VEAAIELQRRCAELAAASGSPEGGVIPIAIGIGIHTGETLIGEVGQLMRDFTVIGPVVNLTARLQGAAGPGEILVTEEVYHEAGDVLGGAEKRTYELKGIELPLTAYVIPAKGPTLSPASAI
jgi:adenylate cyclase